MAIKKKTTKRGGKLPSDITDKDITKYSSEAVKSNYEKKTGRTLPSDKEANIISTPKKSTYKISTPDGQKEVSKKEFEQEKRIVETRQQREERFATEATKTPNKDNINNQSVNSEQVAATSTTTPQESVNRPITTEELNAGLTQEDINNGITLASVGGVTPITAEDIAVGAGLALVPQLALAGSTTLAGLAGTKVSGSAALALLYGVNEFVLSPSELATWASVDNVAGASSFAVSNVAAGVREGSISLAQANEVINISLANIDDAKAFVEQTTMLNPKLAPNAESFLTALEVSEENILITRERLNSLE